MKKWVVSALLVCLATGSLLSGATVSPAMGATTTMKRTSQAPAPAQKPIHDMIVFNDFQVAGLSAGGWNWVKNDEFILPPDTPLDIDITQTTYGSGTNVSRSEVFLDGTELTAFQNEKTAAQASLKWQIPRFTIPSAQLSPGIHTLTFVVTDAKGQKSTVHVRFRVEEQNYPLIYEGDNSVGEPIPTGDTVPIFGVVGSKKFSSKASGKWTLMNSSTKHEMRSAKGTTFSTGSLAFGKYELIFTPDDNNATSWSANLQVGLPELYQGTDENGQKLSQDQKLMAPQAPGTLQLYSPYPGNWWVNGTGQTLTNSQYFEVAIPEMLAGMTINVTFEPNQSSNDSPLKAVSTLQIQVPGTPQACQATTATANMDVLMQNNAKSSLMIEERDLYSSNATVKFYQNPVYLIWLATAADHIKVGSEEDDEEGPGVWAVDNVIVDASKLNWDHTALKLSEYKPGRYKVNYYSKREPRQSWCGYIQVVEDTRPVSSSKVCEQGDSGAVPYPTPMRFLTKKGKQLSDGDHIVVDSISDLDDLEELVLMSTHVENKGTKRIILNQSSRTARRYIHVPDLVWEDGKTFLGSRQESAGGTIQSSNEVKVSFNDKTLLTIEPKRATKDDDRSGDLGSDSLNIKQLIEAQLGQPGIFTIEVTNTMEYRTCQVTYGGKSYTKDTDVLEKKQKMTLKIEVK
ncbi:hypothetical protein EDM59_00730 [Brevibacillus nitrificans]|uniref:Uncharacterized protein n=1 Tax=Brevibacillus nitrificans TaxID=651560 RepID=A0A3M8DS90_9BACL|nr:hypothetical protein [Brevibacillus nitrificans]RNB90942.1 hypothetical protein EDM59_00730 [Brevibacillus nitrificans]